MCGYVAAVSSSMISALVVSALVGRVGSQKLLLRFCFAQQLPCSFKSQHLQRFSPKPRRNLVS